LILPRDSPVAHAARTTLRLVISGLPFALPLIPAIAGIVSAGRGDGEVDEIVWVLWAIPLCALAGAAARAVQIASDGASWPLAVALGVVMALVGALLAYFLWLVALGMTCAGRYECPF
jgi:hypothetical protein